ncbi:MAG: endo-1,4-beta-xylanase [Planctomycetota bacterium]
MLSRFAVACLLVSVVCVSTRAFVLSEFNNTDFDYTFAGFNQTLGPTQIRLSDPVDGWGGAGFGYGTPRDLRGLLNQYLQVDYTVQPGHGTGQFVLEFYDTSDRSVKFSVPTSVGNAGDPQSYTVRNAFDSPTDGIGDFANFDYANVRNFNVLGDFGNPNAFDVSIDRIAFTPVAPEAYGGRSPDAAWRAEADQRIDQLRKANLTVELTRPDGTPIDNAQVRVVQQEHEFRFGSAVVGNKLAGNPTGSDATYRQKVLELFNTVTLENTLKWQALEGEFGGNFSESIALDALQWAQDNDLSARGHVIVWPGNNNLPQSVVDLAGNPAAQRQAVLDHVNDLSAKTQGLVRDWDVVNETRTNNDLLNRFGETVLDEWFAAADANNDAQLFLNEFGIITGNQGNDANRTLYLQTIQGLQQRGAAIDAIGMQGHFSPGDLTDIEQVWNILDQFHGATGLPISITEFDVNTTDRQLQADYLRDFLTAVFAHESIDSFVQWGFWENAHWRPDAALFDANWTIRPAGQAYLDLVYERWWSDLDLATDADGDVETRVFRGKHRVEVTVDGQTRVYDVEVGEAGLTLRDVFVAMLPGDFNGNGRVEQGDLNLVLNNWGQAVADPDALGWVNDAPDGAVDQGELNAVLNNWGVAVAPSFEGLDVPEPAVLAIFAALAMQRFKRVYERD